MKIDQQLTLADVDHEYKAFVEKFKPKKTTDDCYTPPNIYEAVLGWVVQEYGIDPENVVRPFWPGGTTKNMIIRTGAPSWTIRRFRSCRGSVRHTSNTGLSSFYSRHI